MPSFATLLLLAIGLVLLPHSLLAEVSDKMSNPQLSPVIGVGLLLLVVCWRWSKASFVLVPLSIAWAWIGVSDLEDPVLVAYRSEVGESAYSAYMLRYSATLLAMPLGAVVGTVLGVLRRAKQRRAT